jgi:type IV pilus assembly protein PilC
MQTFTYTAMDKSGKRISGTITAENESEARAKLRRMGVFVTGVSRIGRMGLLRTEKKVKVSELALLTEELAAMIEAGISLVRSLDTLIRQVDNPKLKRTVREVQNDLKRGLTFADALSEHPDVFSPFYISIVRAGEAGGVLKDMLFKLAKYLEAEAEFRRKIRSALAYPLIVTAIAFVAVAFLTMFVIPRFSNVYVKIGASLPLPTVILVEISKSVSRFWWALLVFGAGSIYIVRRFFKTPRGRTWLDGFKMKVPILGDLNRKAIASRFLRIFAALINSGIPISDCLDVIEQVFQNSIIAELIYRLKRSVTRGGGISTVLAESYILSPVALQMIAAGEEMGELGEMLGKSSDFLEHEVDVAIRRMVNSLVPILTLVLTLIVGFIVMAIYLPMFDIMGRISG